MRSINTSLIALLPVLGLLVIGVGVLGVGELNDLALVQLVGMLSGAASSLLLATPLAVDFKMRDTKYQAQAKRVLARRENLRRKAEERAAAGITEPEDGAAPRPTVDDDDSLDAELRKERAYAAASGTPSRTPKRPQRRPDQQHQPGQAQALAMAHDPSALALSAALALVREVPISRSPACCSVNLGPVFADGPAFRALIDGLAATLDPATDVLVGHRGAGFLLGGRTRLQPVPEWYRYANPARRRRRTMASPTSSSTAAPTDRGAHRHSRRPAGAARRRRAGHRRHAAGGRRPAGRRGCGAKVASSNSRLHGAGCADSVRPASPC